MNLTGAETSENIVEIYILDDHVKVKLEVSGAPRPVTDTKGLKKALRKLATKKPALVL